VFQQAEGWVWVEAEARCETGVEAGTRPGSVRPGHRHQERSILGRDSVTPCFPRPPAELASGVGFDSGAPIIVSSSSRSLAIGHTDSPLLGGRCQLDDTGRAPSTPPCCRDVCEGSSPFFPPPKTPARGPGIQNRAPRGLHVTIQCCPGAAIRSTKGGDVDRRSAFTNAAAPSSHAHRRTLVIFRLPHRPAPPPLPLPHLI